MMENNKNSLIKQEKPSYYAIIPSDIRYDKDLISMAKLLYGEITALANTYGYCFASNKYFESIYEVSEQTITNWLASLKKKEYIETELIKNDKGQILERRIYIREIVLKNKILKLNHGKNKLSIDTQENLGYNNINNVSSSKSPGSKKDSLFSSFENQNVVSALMEWYEYKKERNEVLSKSSLKKAYETLLELSGANSDRARDIIDYNINGNYSKLFPIKERYCR